MWGRFQRPSRWTLLVPALLGAWIAVRIWQAAGDGPEDLAPESLVEGDYRVVRVLDGGTLLVGPLPKEGASSPDWQARIRLIGIDCPDTPEAKAFTEGFVAEGRVHLRFDKRRRDPEARFVAYAFVGERHLNEELLRAGLARMALLNGEVLILARQLQVAQAEAKSGKRGTWSGE